MMDGWGELVERQIREAMERGAFRDLPGKGKPLLLDDWSLVPEEVRLAHHVMKNQGFLPDWIEAGREIDAERARLMGGEQGGARREEISALNRKIFEYNLRVPLPALQKPMLPVDEGGPGGAVGRGRSGTGE
ncbi:hypothetical protein ATHL_03434 [Anaerolinea thermolimosa]|nr:DUF1992 domain-containing protein [Anaerolinea thermolimosa]GAP08529.1 hypothetical protein ATHL_03434 [Anaerolinea thermolimosa]